MNKKIRINKNVAIISGVVIISLLLGGVWFFVQNKNTKPAEVVEQPNNMQQDTQHNQDQPEGNSSSAGQNFDERVGGEVKIYSNFSRGIQFAYNKSWQAERQERSQNPDNLSFSNLPEGDFLDFSILLGPAGIPGELETLKKEKNNNGFRYEIMRHLGFVDNIINTEEEGKERTELVYLIIRHSVNDQFQGMIYTGSYYLCVYSFPVSKGESYLNQVFSELETIAKSFNYLYNDPYSVKLPSGKKLSFEYTTNFKVTSDQDGVVVLTADDYNLAVKVYYGKPVVVNTNCLSESAKYPIKFDGLTAEYRIYENSKTNIPQCTNVNDVEIIEASVNGEKVFLEFNLPISVDDRILFLVKSIKIQS